MLNCVETDRPNETAHRRVTAPEYAYYFEASSARVSAADASDQLSPEARAPRRLGRALFAGLLNFTVFLGALAAPNTVHPETLLAKTKNSGLEQERSGRGIAALKAQMNALNDGLDNLRRLRGFLNDGRSEGDAVLSRAQRLIETLPQHENAADAAWRIAVVASLTLRSGALADVDANDGYRLSRGAIGWDLGPDGSRVHAGFTPVTPTTLKMNDAADAIHGATALGDGIRALNSFEAPLPNGLYRIFIVRNPADGPDSDPFGGEINLNGAPVKSQFDGVRERLALRGTDNPSSAQGDGGAAARGLGVEGWAIVEDGRLRVDFHDLPAGTAITAIIAEPLEIEKIELAPAVVDALAGALGDVAPAAGPDRRLSGRGSRRNGSGIQSGQKSGARQSPAFSRKAAGGAAAPGGVGSALNRSSFAATRGRTSFSSGTPAIAPSDGDFGAQPSLFATQTDTPFDQREILVKLGTGDGPNSEGIAVDLGSILDAASPSGVFMCSTTPCDATDPIAEEPDLSAALDVLGDWLADPQNVPDGWSDLESVLAARGEGAEVAIIYEFEVDTELWVDVELRASAGSGLFVWLDGDYIFGASQDNGFSDDFEYRLELPDLAGGQHFLQILSESHVPDQGLALELRGTQVPNASVAALSVAEPGTLALYGLGLFATGWFWRRRRCDSSGFATNP